MRQSKQLWELMKADPDAETSVASDYILPLAFRRRALFKMDLAELIYIAELRTAPAGHFSYRNIAYDMYVATKELHPEIASHIRVHDVTKAADLLQR
jgi:thymidylate synthase ThyX